MIRVVLDTNVLIDGSTDDYNYGRRIIDEVIAGHILAFANRPTLDENHLLTRAKIADEGYRQRLGYFFKQVAVVPALNEPINVVEDDEDNKLVEAAAAADADYLITSDRHLLDLEKYKQAKIVRPVQFWSIYEDESDRGWFKWLKNFIHE